MIEKIDQTLEKVFYWFVNVEEKDDIIFINCKKGLWGVSGSNRDRERVFQEAEFYFLQYLFYFLQYLLDGEYNNESKEEN